MKFLRQNKWLAYILIVLIAFSGCGTKDKVTVTPETSVSVVTQTTEVNQVTEVETSEVKIEPSQTSEPVYTTVPTSEKQVSPETTKLVTQSTLENQENLSWFDKTIKELDLENHREIYVDGGDTSPYRENNVKVNIGFGNRDYWGFTNEYGQLVTVIAEKIVPQDDDTEPVNSSGRYYSNMANVPGTESKEYDRGHVIADSLGGVANAYNITPQQYVLNRHGDQAYMEKVIRDAGGAEELVAIITYPNTETQIPNNYTFTYKIMGHEVIDDFPNGNPEDAPIKEDEVGKVNENQHSGTGLVEITDLDKYAEYVEITNISKEDIDISGWKMVSEKGNQSFTFPKNTIIKIGQTLRLTSGKAKGTGDFTMANGDIWNNTSSDPAVLYDYLGNEVARLDN